MLLPSLLWQVLLPKLMADVIAIIVWLMLLPPIILYYNYIALADVIAKLTVADLVAKNVWQMLLPYWCGRCCYHFLIVICFISKVADVLAFVYGRWKPQNICRLCWQMLLPWWLMEWPLKVGNFWQMFKPEWQMELPLVSIILISVLRCSTEPHPKCVCGIWNLPTFLFRDGLLALM